MKTENNPELATLASIKIVTKEEEEMSLSLSFRAKEEHIEMKKMEVREKVFQQLGRVEEETKRLANIREELEALADPTRKEVATLRKKIDTINRELKPLTQYCQKKEKEYKDAMEACNEKNKGKFQLVSKVMELINNSEKVRMNRLEELSRTVDSLHFNQNPDTRNSPA
ncbi:hypothetical protein ZOSMA_165G00320 [Zostera marina]|uniref:RAB6-interacting golgin n=1 Tax=Zostera marina TaxID=29655 RepID=A0A0K9PVX2_ZOSMR|nr:hypothetical protein ZOSMA_165G00320 [Zostera marina]